MSDLVSIIDELRKKHGDTVEVRKKLPWYLLGIEINDGWLYIDDKDDHFNVGWSTSSTSHDLMARPFYSVDVSKETSLMRQVYGLTGAWKTALSLWPVHDKDEAQEIFQMIERLLRRCHGDRKTQSQS